MTEHDVHPESLLDLTLHDVHQATVALRNIGAGSIAMSADELAMTAREIKDLKDLLASVSDTVTELYCEAVKASGEPSVIEHQGKRYMAKRTWQMRTTFPNTEEFLAAVGKLKGGAAIVKAITKVSVVNPKVEEAVLDGKVPVALVSRYAAGTPTKEFIAWEEVKNPS